MSLDTYRKNHSYLYPQTAGGSGTLQIMSGSEIIAAQTWFDEDLAGKVGMPKVYLDPKTRNNYLYSISRDRTHYQITATLQNTQNLIAYLP